MKRFITSLDKKQSLFLRWLLFCFYHSVNCDDGHHPFQLVDDDKLSDVIFGQRFPWSKILRIPSFTKSLHSESKGLLQLEFISLGLTGEWLPTPEGEREHIPSKSQIKNTVDLLVELLSRENITLLSGGIELSRAHVPRNYIRWIECTVMKRVQAAIHRNKMHSKMKFLRYHTYWSPDVDRPTPDEMISAVRNIPQCLRQITSKYI